MDTSWEKIINKKLLQKAKLILDNEANDIDYDEEIKFRKQMIIALCLKYNFKYQFVNNNVFIYSIIDEWYFQYTKNSISLFHKNKIHINKQYHFQRKFKSVIHVIQYIKKHDNFCYKPNKKHKFDIIGKFLKEQEI